MYINKNSERKIMKGKINPNSNALIGDKIYFFETKEEKKLAEERDEIIDKMIAIQDKDKFAWKNSGEWADLQYDLMDIDAKLKKTCSYLSSEISEKFEQGFPIFEDDIIQQ
tara:strand:+ start:613 stop:945 length:333 start_codon:yes stop_codon:yes gene_type:complete